MIGEWNSWLSRNRQTPFNTSLVITKESLDNIPKNFDSIFGGFIDYTDSISFIKLFPFKIETSGDPTKEFFIQTPKGYNQSVPARYPVSTNFILNFGSYFITPYFNNFMDYKGYTYIRVFLPFLGYVELDVNECMNKVLRIRMQVDLNTGTGLYILSTVENDFILGSYEVNLGIDIPLGSSNYGDIMRNVVMGAVKTAAAVGLAYTGNIAASAGVVKTISTSPTEDTETYAIEGQERGIEKGSRLKTTKTLRGARSISKGSITTTETTVRPVNKMKPFAEAIDGSMDALNHSYPSGSSDRPTNGALVWAYGSKAIVYIYRPKVAAFNDNYDETFEEPLGELYGRPLGEFRTLGSLTGHTSIAAIEIQGEDFTQCTNKELEMLENILVDDIIL